MTSRSRLPRATVSQLERIVGRGFVIVDETLLQLYGETRGSDSIRPLAILLPSTDEQVSEIFRLLGERGLVLRCAGAAQV